MPRDYHFLSHETEQVLTDNVKAIAYAWNKTPRYINQILSEERGDPFAPFAELFDAAVRAKLPVCHWLNRLESSRLQYTPILELKEPVECVREKIQSHTKILDKFVEAMANGRLELQEILELQPLIEPAIKALEHLRESLSFQRGLLESQNNNPVRRNGNGQKAGTR